MLGLVIGDSDMVTGFRLVGVEGIEVSSEGQAVAALEKAFARSDLAVIIVSEDFSDQPELRKNIDEARRERIRPIVVELPGSGGKPSGINMSDFISKALGVRM